MLELLALESGVATAAVGIGTGGGGAMNANEPRFEEGKKCVPTLLIRRRHDLIIDLVIDKSIGCFL